MSKPVSGRKDPRFREVPSFKDYSGVDLARTHGFTHSEAAAALDPDMVGEQHRRLLENGYIIIEKLMPPRPFDALREQAAPHLEQVGRNSFEGERTQRIYGLPEKIRRLILSSPTR